MLVAVVGALVAAAVTKLLLEKLKWRWSVVAGLTVAFFPSQIAWSTIVLKDVFVWPGLASLALVVSGSVRNSGWRLAALGTTGALIVFLLGHLRLHSTFVAAVVAIAFISTTQRAVRVSAAVLIASVVPWVSGGGPAGLEPVVNQVDSLEELRLAHAEGARSAIVALPEFEPDSPVDGAADTAPLPGGDTDGPTDEGAEEVGRSLLGRLRGDLTNLPRGPSVMLLKPYPWDAASSLRFVFAKIDTLLRYPLLALAVAGSWSVRRNSRVLLFPLLTGSGIPLMYALGEGNLGTAFRHRGEFVWAVMVLAAFSAQRLRDRLLQRRASLGE